MKRFIAIHGCVAVLSAFLLGPFTHVHQSGGHDPGAGEEVAIVHSHVSFDVAELRGSHGTSVGRVRHGESHEISIFDFQKADRAHAPQPVAIFLHLPESTVQGPTPQMPEAVAHGPPAVDSFGLRSPPA